MYLLSVKLSRSKYITTNKSVVDYSYVFSGKLTQQGVIFYSQSIINIHFTNDTQKYKWLCELCLPLVY